MADDQPRVLLIDDHPLVREAVAATLTAASIRVVGQASTAREGLDLALELRPDVVILDIDLPGRTGLTIVGDLVSRLPETRVVMLSVSTAHSHLVQAIASGASGFLTKDMRPEALIRAIRGVAAGDVAMSREATAALVRAQARSAPRLDQLSRLTPREREILDLLVEGLTDRTIGQRLGVSARTVETHVSNIVQKLRVPNRAAAVAAVRGSDPGGTPGSA